QLSLGTAVTSHNAHVSTHMIAQTPMCLSLFTFFFQCYPAHRDLHSFPTRRSSDLLQEHLPAPGRRYEGFSRRIGQARAIRLEKRSEEHTSELQSRFDLVCRLLLEKKKKRNNHVQK